MHGGPRLNLFGRQLLVGRVTAGWSVAVASEALGASRATGHKWVRRHREEGDAGLANKAQGLERAAGEAAHFAPRLL